MSVVSSSGDSASSPTVTYRKFIDVSSFGGDTDGPAVDEVTLGMEPSGTAPHDRSGRQLEDTRFTISAVNIESTLKETKKRTLV